MDEKAYHVVDESREKDRRSDAPKPSENCSSSDKPVVILNDDEAAPLKEPIRSGGSMPAPPAPAAPADMRGKEIEEDEEMLIGDVELEEFDWAAADAEVDAAMAEDGDEDGDEDEDEGEDDLMDSTDERSLIPLLPHSNFCADSPSRSEQAAEPTSSPSGSRGVKRKRSSASVRSASASASAPSSPIPGRILDPETPQKKRLKTVHEYRPSGLREVVSEDYIEPTSRLEDEIGESQQTVSSVMTQSGHTGVPTTQESVDTGVPTTQESVDTMSQSSEGSTEDDEDDEDAEGDDDDEVDEVDKVNGVDFLTQALTQDARREDEDDGDGDGDGDEESGSDDSDSDSSEEGNG
jgi:hypothetical protein